ncbi:hypothetical protein TMEN_1403, partial [Trichophyton mentagrophytes]
DLSNNITNIFESYTKFIKKIKITFREINKKEAAL